MPHDITLTADSHIEPIVFKYFTCQGAEQVNKSVPDSSAHLDTGLMAGPNRSSHLQEARACWTAYVLLLAHL